LTFRAGIIYADKPTIKLFAIIPVYMQSKSIVSQIIKTRMEETIKI
jgi:hypothetical protein